MLNFPGSATLSALPFAKIEDLAPFWQNPAGSEISGPGQRAIC